MRFKVIFVLLVLIAANVCFAEELRDRKEGMPDFVEEGAKWGVLPRFRTNPEAGFGFGVKMKTANPFGTDLHTDFSLLYTTNKFLIIEWLYMDPSLFGSEWYIMFSGEYDAIPDQRFFGVGNDTENNQDDLDAPREDESSYKLKDIRPLLVIGRPVIGHWRAAGFFQYRNMEIETTENDDLPDLNLKYPGIVGIDGGDVFGAGIAIIRNRKNDQVRPTGGSRIELASTFFLSGSAGDFGFTRHLLDVRYYHNIFGAYNVLAWRAVLEVLEGGDGEIPFFEMSAIGGRDTLRGFWEPRFYGRGKTMANLEYRRHIYTMEDGFGLKFMDFIFDGLVFYDVGRVYSEPVDFFKEIAMDYHQAYGFGFRFTYGPGLMGRADFGFSEEAIGAVYFNFGTVF